MHLKNLVWLFIHLKKFGLVIYALKKIRFDYLCTYKYIDLFVCEHWLNLSN